MNALSLSRGLDRLTDRARSRTFQNVLALSLVVLGPLLALATFLIINVMQQDPISTWLRAVVLADFVYVMILATLVVQRIGRVVAARRARSAGSRLHLRLTGVFALVALVPTVLVAVFATLTVNFGLEGWFSDRVRQVVGNSLAAAQAYEQEHRDGLREDVNLLADFLAENRRRNPFLTDGDLRALLTEGQAQIQRGLKEAYVIDSAAHLRARGERSYLFNYEPPSATDIARAQAGETVVIEDWDNDEFRALAPIPGFLDRFIYISRQVDGGILSLLDDTKETVALYQQLEADRGRLLFEFALIYLAFAIILILAAVWLGLWFAERLSRPVGQLAGAAQRVGAGDLDVRIAESRDDDEIAMLGRIFNQMTRELKGQRDALLDANARSERRRRLFDSVLSGVTTGVIGLGANGQVDFMNPAALRLLDLDPDRDHGRALDEIVPEFGELFAALRQGGDRVQRAEMKVTRRGVLETLLVRMAERRNSVGDVEGYVVTFDDVTDLVSAQRMAAWGDVARRIAHEIKNPLTPIQLSAERLKRKFMPLVGAEDAPALEQYTDVIVRQTGDLRRIVDEFSRFARMPEPDRRENDLVAVLADAVALQRNAGHGEAAGRAELRGDQGDGGREGGDRPARAHRVEIDFEPPDHPIIMSFDPTMLGQAFTNVLKNAIEATESRAEFADSNYRPALRVRLHETPTTVTIEVEDNGSGLPADRARLFEPYVTTRDEGTGLGLPIVRKIIEEHGGSFDLEDAEPFEGCTHCGARAVIVLPKLQATNRREAAA